MPSFLLNHWTTTMTHWAPGFQVSSDIQFPTIIYLWWTETYFPLVFTLHWSERSDGGNVSWFEVYSLHQWSFPVYLMQIISNILCLHPRFHCRNHKRNPFCEDTVLVLVPDTSLFLLHSHKELFQKVSFEHCHRRTLSVPSITVFVNEVSESEQPFKDTNSSHNLKVLCQMNWFLNYVYIMWRL